VLQNTENGKSDSFRHTTFKKHHR